MELRQQTAGEAAGHPSYLYPDYGATRADPVLRSLGDPKARDTLIARDGGEGTHRFDVRLQGEGQTAFFGLGE